MSQITCPVCSFAYASTNITNHLCKAHAGVHISQEAAAAVGLVACSCGQVVMNAVALRKHQGIHKCQTAQPQLVATQPVVSAPAPTPAAPAAVAEAAQPESAPAALAVEQDDPFMQMLDPALFAEGQPKQVDPPAEANSNLDSDSELEDIPLALVNDNLDFVFAEAEAERQAVEAVPVPEPSPEPVPEPEPAPAEDVEEEIEFPDDTSSAEVPAPFPIPTLDLAVAAAEPEEEDVEADMSQQEENSNLELGTPAIPEVHGVEAEADMELDGDTLPHIPVQEQLVQPQQSATPPAAAPQALLPEPMPLDEAHEPVGPAPERVLDNARPAAPALLPIPDLAPITNWDVGADMDVDSFAVTIFPTDILRIFPAGCYLLLISHAPDFKDSNLFEKWVYFAELKVIFRFELQFKMLLIARLQQPPQKAILLASEHDKALTLGELRLEVSILVEALQDIGCQSVRMGAYGIKVPIDRFLDPAMLSQHPMRAANVFDIGCTVDTGHITLIAPKSKKGKYKQYPMALRVGRGFGSVEFRWGGRPDGISHFKGYPKLTHLLKAGAAGAGQGQQPMIVKTVKDRISTLQSWKQRISQAGPEVGGGVRLEVMVQAATMQQACAAAEASHFLDHRFLFSDAAGDLQLLTHTISKTDMFADLDALLAVAEQKQIFRGNHSKPSTQLQRQAVIDLYNAMGWHPGRHPTALDSMTAWWATSQAALDVAQELERFSTPTSTKNLFAHIQIHLRCQKCHQVGTYQLCGGANTFRIRCLCCCASLGAQKFRTHLATLVVNRQLGVDLASLVVDPAHLIFAPVTEDQPVRALSQRRDLNGLVRTEEFANMRESLLECLSLQLEDRRGNPDPVAIREQAVAWLRDHTQAVEHLLGTRSRAAVTACIDKMVVRDAELNKEEEIVLLHGVAGAFDVQIAHLGLLWRSWSCQVIPAGSCGPFIGLVRLTGGGYEVICQSC